MTEPDKSQWQWVVKHGDHVAFYMRAFLVGDFAPGKAMLPNYVCFPDGSIPAPDSTPACAGCAAAVTGPDLVVTHRAYDPKRDWLDAARQELRLKNKPWPPGTDPATCYNCNEKRDAAVIDLSHQAVANRYAEGDDPPPTDASVPVCVPCACHLVRVEQEAAR